jgi:hypothetical protein
MRLGTGRAALAVLAYAVLTTVWLWPLSAAPGRLALVNPDTLGNAWTMAFVVGQVARDPLRLYDANIFHPTPHALAFTETLFPQSLMAAPILLLGGGPLLAHNLVLLLTFPLSGLAAFLLARDLGASEGGAFLAGLAFAFSGHRFEHLVHAQSLSMQWLPLVILFLRRACVGGSRRDAVLAGLFCLLQALSSGYYGVLTAAAGGAVPAFHFRPAWREGRLSRVLAALAAAGVVALLVYLPTRAALRREERLHGIPAARSLEEQRHWSADLAGYLTPGRFADRPHQDWLRRTLRGRGAFYPGLAVLVLGALGALAARRRAENRLLLLLGAIGLLLSVGPEIRLGPVVLPGPFAALRSLPGFAMLRTPVRLGVLALLALTVLAALGWTRVHERLGRARRPALLFVVALLLFELRPAGLSTRFREPLPEPPTAAWLARVARGPVLELPWDHETMDLASFYIYWSLRHRQPMVNGWGGFYPRGPFELGVLGKLFPSDYSSRELRRAGVRYVVVHRDLIPADRPGRQARAAASGRLPEGVRLAAEMGPHRVYELDPLGPVAAPR